ncbi:hypothetical protein BH09PSE1_BH09PSE1_19060 [soil metagenome]
MKSSLAVVAVVLTVAIAGCDKRADTPAETPTSPPADAVVAPAPTVGRIAPEAPVAPARLSVPDFAAVYPDGKIEGEPLTATSESGPGGVVTFTTDAKPDTVVAFYRERAEAAGLATMMSLNQGEARAYGALKQASGATVNVVASPLADKTSVQLTWSAGQ